MRISWLIIPSLLAGLILEINFAGAQSNQNTFEDPLPRHCLQRFGTTRLRQGIGLTSLAFSKDNKYVISAGYNRIINFWDRKTGQRLKRLKQKSGVCAFALSPDGKRIYSGDTKGMISVWDLKTGNLIRQWQEGKRRIHEIKILPNARLGIISGSQVGIWTPEGKELQTICLFKLFSNGVFSPDGKRFAVTETRDLQLWDVKTGNPIGFLQGHSGTPLHVGFSKDGKWLASGCENKLILWKIGKGPKKVAEWNVTVTSHPVFSPDGKLLFVGSEKLRNPGKIQEAVWYDILGIELAGKKAIRKFRLPANELAFSPDGKTLAASTNEGCIHLLDPITGQKQILDSVAHQSSLDYFSLFSPKNNRLVTAAGNRVYGWNLKTGQMVYAIKDSQNLISCLASSRDETKLYIGAREFGEEEIATNFLYTYDVRSGKRLKSKNLAGTLSVMEISPGGEFFLTRDSKDIIRCWNMSSGKQHFQKVSPTNLFEMTPDGKSVVFSNQRSIELLDLRTGKKRVSLQLKDPQSTMFAVSRDSRFLVFYDNSNIRRYDLDKNQELKPAIYSGVYTDTLLISPDGKLVASTWYGVNEMASFAGVWEVSSGKEVRKTKFEIGLVFRFSPDNRCLLASQDDDLLLWELATGKERLRLSGSFMSARILPGGRTMLASESNNTVSLWDITGGKASEKQPRLTPAELKNCWDHLKGQDARKAYRAIWAMVYSPRETLPFLRHQLAPVHIPEKDEINQLVDQLDSRRFRQRVMAQKKLEQFGRGIKGVLKQLQETKKSSEVQRRIKLILEKMEELWDNPQNLRKLRAIEVLERMNNADSKKLLQALANGNREALLTIEAKEALRRLKGGEN